MSSLELEKRIRRAEAQRQRDALAPEARASASRTAADRVLEVAPERGRVALFSARGSEIDPRWLAEALQLEGALLAYPRVEGAKMVFAAPGPSGLVPGGFGLLEPPAGSTLIEPESLDFILVPGLLFDRERGHRLGYGKGYFDRLLGPLSEAETRPRFIGFAFEAQVVTDLPVGPRDVPVDVLVTEERTRWFPAPDER